MRWLYRLLNAGRVSTFVQAAEDALAIQHHDRWQSAVGREIQSSRDIIATINRTGL